MRTRGTLKSWNDDRGYGFIEPSVGTDELFVHISAFPRDGVRPRIGETVSFEVERRDDGKRRAVHVMRPGARAVVPARRKRSRNDREGPFARIVGMLMLGAIGWYGYSHVSRVERSADATSAVHALHAAPARPALRDPESRCDGRTRCAQMTSCAEATYFLKQCPNTAMDGDGDGVPCEGQWCGSPRSRW